MDRALELAKRVAAQAPLGVQATLASARTAQLHGEAVAAKDLVRGAMKLFESEDAQEGVASFLERRTAIFKGK